MNGENKNNQINNTGDDSINIQDTNAQNITINKTEIKTEVSPEILEKRKELIARIDEIKSLLQDVKPYSILPEETVEEDKFDIDWDGLMEAIEQKDCVLFIGQGIYTDEDGNSLHEKFFKSISKGKIKYNDRDGFFMPQNEERVATKAKRYYNKEFLQDNSEARGLIEKLAQIKFPLIVNISPDDTVHKVYSGFNIPHRFLYYVPRTNQSEMIEDDSDQPIIYNLLGNAASRSGNYIYTHAQFYDYINERQEVKVPLRIEEIIRSASFYLFIGVDFNKWYNRLLLFALKFSNNPEAYAFNSKQIDEIHKEFIDNQFNIAFVNDNHKDFVNLLVNKAYEWNQENPEPGVFRNLGQTFRQNIDNELDKYKDSINKSDSLVQLRESEQYIQLIKETITKFTSND